MRSPRRVAEGVEVVAIGDVHGMPGLLAAALDVAATMPREAARRELVLLGDLVDRGPASLATLEVAAGGAARAGADAQVALMGNHEQMMALALAPDAGRDEVGIWINNGGASVVAEVRGLEPPGTDARGLLRALRRRAGTWVEGLRPHHRSGDVLFVHAGVHPNRDLARFLATPWRMPLAELEESEHWAWVREPFLWDEPGEAGHHGLLVVHGHSIIGVDDLTRDDARRMARSRVNLDGGSYLRNVARVGRFVGDEVEVVDVVGA